MPGNRWKLPRKILRREIEVEHLPFAVAIRGQHLAGLALLQRRNGAVSIPFRRETEIGEPAVASRHRRYFGHLGLRKLEVEDLDVLRQPFQPRGSRDRRYLLLHQPAQADLGCAL